MGEAAGAPRERAARWRTGPPGGDAGGGPAVIEVGPATAYEAVTRQMVEALREDLREIKGRLNGLLWMAAGTMLLDVALRLAEGR